MIERLPLDIFDDRPAGTGEPAPAPETEAGAPDPQPETLDPAEDAGTSGFLVSCQWCGEQLDNELAVCPHCGGNHRRMASAEEDSPAVTCQWCLTTVEPGADRCPECHARIVVPGQHIPGLNDPLPVFSSYEVRLRQAQSQQMLAGMMMGGGLDSLVGGLIGLALAFFDD
jgi:hypothetical protein